MYKRQDKEGRNGRTAPSSTKYYQKLIKLDGAENGKDVLHDGKTMGEVVVRSPGLTLGYWKDTERIAKF